MRIYVAGKYEDRLIIRSIHKTLIKMGHEITVDWTNHDIYPNDAAALKQSQFAQDDVIGVLDAEKSCIISHLAAHVAQPGQIVFAETPAVPRLDLLQRVALRHPLTHQLLHELEATVTERLNSNSFDIHSVGLSNRSTVCVTSQPMAQRVLSTLPLG